MQNEKVFNFLKKKGTLGVLTLCLVGAVAFVSYRTSYPEEEKTQKQQTAEENVGQETEEAEERNLAVAGSDVEALIGEKNGTDLAGVYAGQTEGIKEEASAGEQTEEPDDSLQNKEQADAIEGAEPGTLAQKQAEENSEEGEEVISTSVLQPTVSFGEDSSMVWPAAGTILMDYNMDGTVYFKTLNEYKYNPALIIGSEVGNPVVASAKGIVESISVNEETGTTLVMNIGDNYELIYGQLQDVTVSEGDVAEQGQILGYVGEPTKYYCEEGSNLYFAMKKDGEVTDPCLYLE